MAMWLPTLYVLHCACFIFVKRAEPAALTVGRIVSRERKKQGNGIDENRGCDRWFQDNDHADVSSLNCRFISLKLKRDI